MGQRASWIIDKVLALSWAVASGLSSPVDDNPVIVLPGSGGDRTTSGGATRTTSALNDRTLS